jgi:hypothetical protein
VVFSENGQVCRYYFAVPNRRSHQVITIASTDRQWERCGEKVLIHRGLDEQKIANRNAMSPIAVSPVVRVRGISSQDDRLSRVFQANPGHKGGATIHQTDVNSAFPHRNVRYRRMAQSKGSLVKSTLSISIQILGTFAGGITLNHGAGFAGHRG